ncbi:MAG: universal stress protein [Deltaproteobacteria bacterium]|nr:universal stress protein [Deltaproteobacteria bacterium]
MFRKLIVPADLAGMFEDFSSCFQGAPAAGVEEVHLVHLFPPHGVRSYFRQIDQPYLERQAEALRGLGLSVTAHTAVGSPAREINRVAAERRADAVAVCSLSHGVIEELVLHPVADALLHDARFPLLVLNCGRERPASAPFENLFRHILFATDFSEGAQEAEGLVERIAAAKKSRVTLVHVQEQRRIFPHLEDRLAEFTRVDRERLRALERRLRKKGASAVDLHVPCGHPVPVLLGLLRDLQPSLTILGHQGRDRVTEFVTGSVAHGVARGASTPVLLIPARPRPGT